MKSLYSVHLSTAKSWRGGENQIWLLAKGLLARGQKVLVLAPEDAPLHERCAAAGIPTRVLTVRGSMDPLGTLRLYKVLRKEKPDVLHLHDGHAVMAGQIAARGMTREKLRVVVHRRTVFALRGRWKYGGRVDRVIAISSAVKDQCVAAGLQQDQIRVVYSGLDFPPPAENVAVAEFRVRLKLSTDDFVIAHAAALTSEKRQLDMIRAVADVNERLKVHKRPGVHLVLAGTGDQEQILQREAQARGQDGNIHFLGFIKDLRALWASSTIALYASEAEGLCTALIEAQGAGLPALITRAGGMTEVVEDGVSGLVVEIGDVAKMTASILELLDQAELRRKMGVAAAARMRDKFSASAMVEGIDRVYRELCR
jgi:glycosyltransferase involved in cell wall biosynthesis